MKTSVQQNDHSSSATYMFADHRLLTFPLNVITAKRHHRYNGITASGLPSHGITVKFPPVSAVITVVSAVLPLSPLSCHPLLQNLTQRRTANAMYTERNSG